MAERKTMTTSTNQSRSPGRPHLVSPVRDDLIRHARTLFIAHPYEKVSTRMVANRAGVNMGMIRYYFNNKAGLFETMLRETVEPMHQLMASSKITSSENFLLVFMNNFYRVMAQHTNFPRFIGRTMQLSPDAIPRQITENVMLAQTALMHEKAHQELNAEGVMKAGVNAKLTHFTMLSLTLFPFVAPPEMLKLHGITIDDNFLSELLEHNTRLLNQGIIN
jgi:AcrR family transcriptional regulator